MLAGTYMAEYGRYSKLTTIIRFINDILLSAPSIVIGLFVYTVLVARMGHFSAMVRSRGARHAGDPGGASAPRRTCCFWCRAPCAKPRPRLACRARMSFMHVAYRAAKSGLITGLLLAVARVSGETAPLLFTALNNQFWSLDLNEPMASLPVVIFQFALSPYKDWQQLAWTGALLVTATVLTLSILARTLSRQRTANDRPPKPLQIWSIKFPCAISNFFYGASWR